MRRPNASTKTPSRCRADTGPTTPADHARHPPAHCLVGRQLQIGVSNVQPAFGGRLRVQGRLLSVSE